MTRATIGQVARRAGVEVDTIRFYERRGLLEEPPRSDSGYRLYSDEAVERLQFIRRAKDLGFTLNEIDDLLPLLAAPTTPTTKLREQAQSKLENIDAKLRALERMRDTLLELVQACDQSDEGCPILGALTAEGES